MNKIIRITFDYQDDVVQFMRADGTIRTRPYVLIHWNRVVRGIYSPEIVDKFWYDAYGLHKDRPALYYRYGEFKRYEEIA